MAHARIPQTLLVCLIVTPLAFTQNLIRVHYGTAGSPGSFGSTGAEIGDVDLDGVDDYAIGAPTANLSHGRVLVYSGATGALLFELSGGPIDSKFGTWVDGVGDVDLDGAADLVVGAMNLVDQPDDVRVFSGASQQTIWSKSGTQSGGAMSTVRGAGDMNLDGVPDVLAQTYASPTLGHRVVILRGQTGANAGFVGPALGDFGQALDGGVDVNGDGVPEILVGAPSAQAVGRVYLYDGATRTESWHVDGVTPDARFGFDVSFGNDVDGDGIEDVAALATKESKPLEPIQYFGSVRVLSGATGGTNWLRYGRKHESLFDAQIDFSHDLDGDAIADVLVSSPREAYVDGWAPFIDGIARIFSGVDGATRSAVADPTAYPWELGWHSFSTGDLTGDGLADFVIGGGGSSNSAAWVYGSVGNGGTASYSGGPVPGTPTGCSGSVGFQCHLVNTLAPASLEFEGCFTSSGRAILYVDTGLAPPVTLLLVGAQPTQATFPGGCSLLVTPLHTIVVYPMSMIAVTFPANVPSSTLYLQALSYVTQPAPPFGYECLQIASSARVQVTFP